jgi:quinolinate synthase
LKQEHPAALVMAHPECPPSVLKIADEVLSTSGMCRVAAESDAVEFIVATEVGMLHRLKKENPLKEFYPAARNAVCKNMKMINLEKILWSLEDMAPEITVPAEIREQALTAIQRMVDIH